MINFDWLTDQITQVAILAIIGIAVLVIAVARRGKIGSAMTMAAVVLIGIVVIAMAGLVGGAFGDNVVSNLFS